MQYLIYGLLLLGSEIPVPLGVVQGLRSRERGSKSAAAKKCIVPELEIESLLSRNTKIINSQFLVITIRETLV